MPSVLTSGQSTSPLERKMAFLAWLNSELDKRFKTRTILVGGSAVELYSGGHFQSADIDVIYARNADLDVVLSGNGFKKDGRYWVNDEIDIQIEAPSDRLEGDMGHVACVTYGNAGEVYVIGLEDLVLDRLRAAKYWKDSVSLEQASFLLAVSETDGIDAGYLLGKIESEKGLSDFIRATESETPVFRYLDGK